MGFRGSEDTAAIDDHGGSLERAQALFPHAAQPWLDLSTGINPHSYPVSALPATAFSRLPEPGRIAALEARAAAAYGVRPPARTVASPGTQILLPLVAALVAPGGAAILSPTYAEHRRAATLAGHRVTETQDLAALAEASLAVVVNPNNPDGRVTDRDTLLALADRLGARGGVLVVDEAFMEAAGAGVESLAGHAGRPGLVVLRSFGKFYGLPGLRLGFALADPKLAAAIAGRLGPWAVSGPALETAMTALADRDWQVAMRGRLADETGRLGTLLLEHGLAVTGGTGLFCCVDHADAPRLFDTLGAHGILVRNFAGQKQRLRFGLPPDESGWSRLSNALASWRRSAPQRESA
ncbi:MAG: threonine-phosphate decarboxylase CobD [Mesorhizobium sp.]